MAYNGKPFVYFGSSQRLVEERKRVLSNENVVSLIEIWENDANFTRSECDVDCAVFFNFASRMPPHLQAVTFYNSCTTRGDKSAAEVKSCEGFDH